MCGIGLLVRGIGPHQCQNGVEEGVEDMRAIEELHASWEVDAKCADLTVRSFFPVKTSRFTEEDLQDALRRRGPDQQGSRKFEGVSLFGAVLHLRGEELAKQPYDLPDGSAFAYNGEIFGLRNRLSFMESVFRSTDAITNESKAELELFAASRFSADDGGSWLESNVISDTCWLAESMTELETISNEELDFDILLKCLMEQICGPIALLHFCPRRNRVFGMRDVLGRRSLCVNVNPDGDLCLANVALGDSAVELHCTGAWVLQLSPSKSTIRCLPRSLADPFADDLSFVRWRKNSTDPRAVAHFQCLFNDALREAVRKRVAHQDSVGLLFSGGLDSSVLAVLAAQEMLKVQGTKSLQLINVSFDPALAPDRHTCLLSYRDILRKLYGSADDVVVQNGAQNGVLSSIIQSGSSALTVELILIDEKYDTVAADDADAKKRIISLLGPNNTHMDFNICACLWRGAAGAKEVTATTGSSSGFDARSTQEAVEKSYFSVTPESLGWESFEKLVSSAHVAEFKRGGDDKKLRERLEKLASEFGTEGKEFYIEDVEQKLLRNFFPHEFPHVVHGSGSVNGYNGTCGETANSSSRDDETPPTDSGKIDVSLYTNRDQNGKPRTDCSSAASADRFKVLLLGHGADEILGGYARHISAFEHRGIEGLQQELLLDCRRLWTRNLGRDDRVVSDWSREARHPFLDEGFIDVVVKMLPCLPDKLWLRNFAASELGLAASAARYEKRAIQFGTRIAKQSNKEKFESNRKAKGHQKYV